MMLILAQRGRLPSVTGSALPVLSQTNRLITAPASGLESSKWCMQSRRGMKASYREPAVAGLFYPGDPDDLRHAIASYGANVEPKIRALGCVVPHAGYVYSG